MNRSILLVASLVAGVVAAAERRPVVAVFPVRADTPELARLGLLIEARADALLLAVGKHTVLDMKQVLAMAGQEGWDVGQLADEAIADRARVIIGADVAVAVTLKQSGATLTLAGTVRDGKKSVPFMAELPQGWAEALTQGSAAITRALLEREKATLDPALSAQPQSKSSEALAALGGCWEAALRQPMGIDAPVGLSEDELARALEACRAAAKADPSLRFAVATEALLLAIAHEDEAAQTLLGPGTADDPALVPWVLARYWSSSRAVSSEAAVKFLGGVVKAHPTALLVRALEANALSAMNEQGKAVLAWNEYLKLAPSAFAYGRLSQALGRQEQYPAAIAAATKGLALAPESREARLALATRLLHAGRREEAKKALAPLVASERPPAEAMLQLGLADLEAGDAKSAKALFQAASDRATGARAWKTKGRALYSLAVLEAKAGHGDAAKQLYLQSVNTGLAVRPVDPALAALVGGSGGGSEAQKGGGLYFNLAPLQAPEATLPVADGVLHDKLASLGGVIAPAGEDKAAALKVLKAQKLKGYELRVKVASVDGAAYRVEMLVLSYPEEALKGSWSVKASGAKPEVLVKKMMAKVVDDAAGDLDWK